jgi:SAM-dependent methyltransferase
VTERYQTAEYIEHNPTYHLEDASWKATQVSKMLRRHDLRPSSVCDVGCGAGGVLSHLQPSLPEDTRLHGFDISPHAAQFWNRLRNDKLRFTCGDLLEVSLQRWDLLLCLDVFEHVEDYVGFLKRLRLKASHTIFHIPLDLSVQSVARSTPILQNRDKFGHLHYFTRETAIATLLDAGYGIVDTFYTASGIERATTTGEKMAKWPRKIAAMFSQDLAARFLGGYSLLVLARE